MNRDSDPRRILFFITGLHIGGGAEAQLVRLATHLARSGWRVSVVSLMPGNHFASELERAGVSSGSLAIPRGRYDPRALTRLVGELRSERPTILCTFLFHANVLGRVAARLAGTPIVVSSVRNVDFGGRWADRLLRWTDRLCDLTTTNSRLAADALSKRRVVRDGALRVVPNGIDTRPLDALERDRSWLDDQVGNRSESFVFLAVGRLEPQKAYAVTLDGLARLIDDGHDIHLAIAGEGSQRASLEAEARRLGIADRVTLLGTRNDVPRLMRSADALVLSSSWEGLPNVVMEAHAARTPVVATRVGGVPELVEHGRTGLLVAPNEPIALAEAMANLIAMSPEARQRMADRGRRHVDEHYELATVMHSWERLFDELVARRTGV